MKLRTPDLRVIIEALEDKIRSYEALQDDESYPAEDRPRLVDDLGRTKHVLSVVRKEYEER